MVEGSRFNVAKNMRSSRSEPLAETASLYFSADRRTNFSFDNGPGAGAFNIGVKAR